MALKSRRPKNSYRAGALLGHGGRGAPLPAACRGTAPDRPVDEHIDNAMKMPYNDSFSEWSKVSWDGNTGTTNYS